MVTLNIGCGRDPWGDIRLDFAKSQTGVLNKPNVIAIAESMPLREMTIRETRCWHVIEHVKDWKGLLAEIGRVSADSALVQLRFPIDDGYKRDFLISWSRSDLSGMRHAYLTRKTRAHFWIINPHSVSDQMRQLGFSIEIRRGRRSLFLPSWVTFPRWRRLLPQTVMVLGRTDLFRRICHYLPQVDYEWVLIGTRTGFSR